MAVWARAILWGSVALVVILALWPRALGAEPLSRHERLLALSFLLVPPLLDWLIGVLIVRVLPNGVEARMGRSGLIRKTFLWEEVAKAEAVAYRPLREFGGWGIRFGIGNKAKRAWTQRGDRAVVLHLRNGNRFYLGSDHPERLLERMRGASGRRLDAEDG